MNPLFFTLILILVTGIFLAGCTNQAQEEKSGNINPEPAVKDVTTPEMTSQGDGGRENEKNREWEQSMNTSEDRIKVSEETMPLNSTKDIYLKENPTTGFQWNATITRGLVIETDEYMADHVKPGIVGSGGTHHWMIRGVERGNQTFDAVYRRSWEPLTRNETRYTLNIIIE
jgi:inhibitor of cysteine peptidase